ncbi:hypothetical protein ACE1MS_22725 (plasmid) [Lysinibacillus sp. fkY74-1]
MYIITRENSNNVSFVFQGLGYVREFDDSKPAHKVWGLIDNLAIVSDKYKADKEKIR